MHLVRLLGSLTLVISLGTTRWLFWEPSVRPAAVWLFISLGTTRWLFWETTLHSASAAATTGPSSAGTMLSQSNRAACTACHSVSRTYRPKSAAP